MYFKYSEYYRGCLDVPTCISVGLSCILIASVLYFIWLMLKKQLSRPIVIKILLSILVFGSLLYINVGIILHGGIYLRNESESDAIEMQGYIEEINEVESYRFPNLGSKYGTGQGAVFTINGVQCTAILQGTLEVGDYVLVRYLPKSRYVLYIGVIDESEPTS